MTRPQSGLAIVGHFSKVGKMARAKRSEIQQGNPGKAVLPFCKQNTGGGRKCISTSDVGARSCEVVSGVKIEILTARSYKSQEKRTSLGFGPKVIQVRDPPFQCSVTD